MANNVDQTLRNIVLREKAAEEELAKAKQQLSNVELRLREFEKKEKEKERIQLKYPLDENTIKAIVLGLEGRLDILDLISTNLWRRMFIWATFFESLDGFFKDPAANVTLTHNDIRIITGDVAGNITRVMKQPAWQGVITFYKRNSFRTTFTLTSVSNVEVWLTVGNSEITSPHYGFKVVNNVLKGFTGDSSSETYVDLQTITTGQVYNVEARYYPNEKVLFFVNPIGKLYTQPTGIITTTLPPAKAEVNNTLMDIRIKTNDAVNKTIQLSFWQYIQSREYNE